jgi:hypothetical protein
MPTSVEDIVEAAAPGVLRKGIVAKAKRCRVGVTHALALLVLGFGVSAKSADLAACRRPDDVNSVVFRGFDNKIYELFLRPGASQWQLADLSTPTQTTVGAAGHPACYTRSDKAYSIVYRGIDGHIYELWLSSTWRLADLSATSGAPLAAGDPTAYVRHDGVSSVVYRGIDDHIYELFLPADAQALFGFFPWAFGDLSAQAGAPPAAGNPVGYARWENVNSVVYRAFDNRIHELWLAGGGRTWSVSDISGGSALAQGDPATFVRLGSSVVYRGFDNHIHQLFLPGGGSIWEKSDISAAAGGGWTTAVDDPVSYVRSDGAASVEFCAIDGHIYELFFTEKLGGRGWAVADLGSDHIPAGVPAAYARSDNFDSVLYRGADFHIYEVYRLFSGSALDTGVAELSKAALAQ